MNRAVSFSISAAAALAVLAAGQPAAAQTRPVAPVPPVPTFDKSDPVAYGTKLIHYVEARDSGWRDLYGKARLTLVDAGGDAVTKDVVFSILENEGGNRSLARFLSPAEIRGTGVLIYDRLSGSDDTWLYMPASQRTRRIAGANRAASFQGTEFTYEDISRMNGATRHAHNYDWKFVRDGTLGGQPVYLIEGRPNYDDSGYSKILVYVDQKWRVPRIDYFDHAGRHLKTLTQSKWMLVHGRFWRARRCKMANHQTRKTTLVDMPVILLDLSRYRGRDGKAYENLTPADFTRRALENS